VVGLNTSFLWVQVSGRRKNEKKKRKIRSKGNGTKSERSRSRAECVEEEGRGNFKGFLRSPFTNKAFDISSTFFFNEMKKKTPMEWGCMALAGCTEWTTRSPRASQPLKIPNKTI
jgi:hypothetical protein